MDLGLLLYFWRKIMSFVEKASEKLGKLIPEYGCYLDEEKRRDEDKKVREFIAEKLNEAIKSLEETKLELVMEGNYLY
jgi:hypothetical protein